MYHCHAISTVSVLDLYGPIGVMAELTISNLPKYDNSEEHAESHLSTLSISGVKSSMRGLVVPIGSPKYVKGIVPIMQPNVANNLCILSSSTFIEIPSISSNLVAVLCLWW
jgi:hypothetical protein